MSEVTVFVYSSGKLVAEYSTAPPEENPTTKWTVTDQLGSPRVLVNSLGEVVSRRDFMPFGEEIFPDGVHRTTNLKYNFGDNVRQKFTGYQKDEETQLDFAEARMYQNLHGRFTAVDPLTASGKSSHPQTFNRYIYVGNDPVNLRDPDGLQWYVAFEVQRVNGKLRTVAVSPQWIDGSRKYGRRQWGTPGTFTENGRRVSYDASWVFFDPYHKKHAAVDQWEPRDPKKHMFDSMEAAQDQIGQWNRQAMVNFIAGAANAASLVLTITGADGLVAETNSNMYAIGQRAGTAGSLVAAGTGLGFANAVINKVGRGGISIMKEMGILQQLSRASVDDKLARYLLNASHSGGGAEKAKWFKEALGFTKENADDLARQIVFDASTAIETATTKHGVKFNQTIAITGANGKVIEVNFAWIRNNDGVERLVTAIPTRR